jgi:hypothetical protein
VNRFWCLTISIILALIVLGGCSSSVDDNTITAESSDTAEDINTLLSSQGLVLDKVVEIDGDKGYLAIYPGKFTQGVNAEGKEVGPIPKRCMILTGKPYSMGYQSAMLMPEEGYRMMTDFMKRLGLGEFKRIGLSNLPTEGPESVESYRLLFETLVEVAGLIKNDVPVYLRLEMQGFADGMNAAGYMKCGPEYADRPINYDHLLALNQAIDGTFYLLGAALGYVPETDKNKEIIKKCRNTFFTIVRGGLSGNNSDTNAGKETDSAMLAKFKAAYEKSGAGLPLFGCNEFVLTGSMTDTGHTYHGRDFMFATGDVFQDTACMVVRLPDRGYPFASTAAPGFIGQSVGMNIKGLSVAQDICMASAIGDNPGLGSMIVVRDVAQNCATLSNAVSHVKRMPRGVPWIYFIVDDEYDGEYGCGVELGTVTNLRNKDVTDGTILPLVTRGILLNMGLWDDFKDGIAQIDNGVYARGAGWSYPTDAEYNSDNFDMDFLQNDRPKSLLEYKEHYKSGRKFTPQNEENSEMLVSTNFLLAPQMRMFQFETVMQLIYGTSGELGDSTWRYNNMLKYISDSKEINGKIRFFGDNPDYPERGTAGWIIDFLNTKNDYPWYYRDKERCKDCDSIDSCTSDKWEFSPDTSVLGHHTVIDNNALEIRSLYGYMTDPWVGIKLKPFVDWYYGPGRF